MDAALAAKLTEVLTAAPVFLFSLVFHEYCHALAAYRLGDSTAAWTGRLTMDPRVHIDLLGTVILPVVGLLGGGFIFGWAKPVPFNPRNLKNPGRDAMIIALAGPAANVALLVVFSLLARGLLVVGAGDPSSLMNLLLAMSSFGIFINALLAVFNMIPLPPLDGSKVLAHFLSPSAGRKLLSFNAGMSFMIIIFLVYQGALRTPMHLLMQLGRGLAGV